MTIIPAWKAMEIKVVSVDRSNLVVFSENVFGYHVVFDCPRVTGSAVLIPSGGGEESIFAGSVLRVETSYEGVSNFLILPRSVAHSIKQLIKKGDYHIVGSVFMNSADEVFYIDVGGISFSLSTEETKGIIPQLGETIEFIIHGLVLQDENY